MSDLNPAPGGGAAIGLDHVGVVGADLDALAQAFSGLGFHLTPVAMHAGGRTANRCVMLRDGGYLELIATLPGQSSATLDRFLGRGPGAHILALEAGDERAALDRLRRAGIACEVSTTERDAGLDGVKARFALLMPPDPPEGRMLLIRHLSRDLLWRPDNTRHPNRAVMLTEAVYASDAPAETMTRLSRITGRPAEPDPLGGYRIPLARGVLRILPPPVAGALFPGATAGPPLTGLTIAAEVTGTRGASVANPRRVDTIDLTDAGQMAAGGDGNVRVVHAGGVAIRFTVVTA
jgi:hypothetical protein